MKFKQYIDKHGHLIISETTYKARNCPKCNFLYFFYCPSCHRKEASWRYRNMYDRCYDTIVGDILCDSEHCGGSMASLVDKYNK